VRFSLTIRRAHMQNGLNEYRRLGLEDSATFRRWLLANTVVGALSLFALIVVASLPGGDSAATTKMASSAALAQPR
jgi:hypothetical protein